MKNGKKTTTTPPAARGVFNLPFQAIGSSWHIKRGDTNKEGTTEEQQQPYKPTKSN
jgi:hypothetical protein